MERFIHFTLKNRPSLDRLVEIFQEINQRRFGGKFTIGKRSTAKMVEVKFKDVIPGTMMHRCIAMNGMFFLHSKVVSASDQYLTGWHEYVGNVFMHEAAKILDGKLSDDKTSPADERNDPAPQNFAQFTQWLPTSRWPASDSQHCPPLFRGY